MRVPEGVGHDCSDAMVSDPDDIDVVPPML